MSSWAPTKYKTTNWSAYSDSLKRRGSLSIWFDPEMVWVPPPSGKRGRQQSFSDTAIQAYLTLKGEGRPGNRPLACFSPERAKPWAVRNAASADDRVCPKLVTSHRLGLVRARLQHPVPTPKTLNVSLPYRGGSGPLNLLIDSTGIKAEGESEWNARKHGGSKPRIWRKIHIGIDEETLGVRAVEVTTSNVGDAPILPELLNRIPADETIGLGEPANANGAYDTRRCHNAIAARNAHAVIPPRKNAKPWKPTTDGPSRVTRRSAPRVAWATPYGDDSAGITAGALSKQGLLGQSLMARNFGRQVAESKSVSRSLTATPLLAFRLQSP